MPLRWRCFVLVYFFIFFIYLFFFYTGATTTWGLAIADSEFCCGMLSGELDGALRGLVCSLLGPACAMVLGREVPCSFLIDE